jgi:ABC-type Mn2+/Zn2+ transport system permease subunit
MSWLDSYLGRAVLEVILVGILCGVVGVQVVLRRLSFFAMAMTHATFPGVVLAAILGLNIYLGGFVAGLLVSLAVLAAGRRRGQDTATATGVVLATGFAFGVALMSTQSGFTRNLSAFLVGSVLTVNRTDLVTAAAVGAAVLLTITLLHKELTFAAFDPDGARAAGYRTSALDLAMLVLVQAAIVITVPAVGTILGVALLVGPAAAARLWTERIGTMYALAAALAVTAGLIGLAVSERFTVAAGGAISLVAATIFLLSWLAAPRHSALAALKRAARRRPTDRHPALLSEGNT